MDISLNQLAKDLQLNMFNAHNIFQNLNKPRIRTLGPSEINFLQPKKKHQPLLIRPTDDFKESVRTNKFSLPSRNSSNGFNRSKISI